MPQPIVFAGASLDRAPFERRRPDWLAARRSDPGARSLVLSERGLWIDDGHLVLVPPNGDSVFLGLSGERPLFAQDAGDAEPERGRPAGLREAATELPAEEAGAGRVCRVAARLAPAPPLLRQLRQADRARRRRPRAPLPGTATPITSRAPTPS